MTGETEFDMETIAALDEMLSSPDAPEGCMQLSELDGFLTGLAVAPEGVELEDWLPMVVADGFENPDDAEEAKVLLVEHYERIAGDLADGFSIDPLFWEDDNGKVDAGEWADGFMAAVDMAPEAWLPILEDQEARMHMVPILALACDEDGAPLLRLTGPDLERIVDNVETVIPKAVEEIRDYWYRQDLP
jgi:uncharacterized protein